MKKLILLAALAVFAGGCAIVPAGYGDNHGGYYQDRGHNRGDGNYRDYGNRGDNGNYGNQGGYNHDHGG